MRQISNFYPKMYSQKFQQNQPNFKAIIEIPDKQGLMDGLKKNCASDTNFNLTPFLNFITGLFNELCDQGGNLKDIPKGASFKDFLLSITPRGSITIMHPPSIEQEEGNWRFTTNLLNPEHNEQTPLEQVIAAIKKRMVLVIGSQDPNVIKQHAQLEDIKHAIGLFSTKVQK